MKLSTLLAKTEHSAAQYKKLLQSYIAFFKNSQTAFRGIIKTYTALGEHPDMPNERGVMKVVTTVKEKLNYLEQNVGAHIDNIFKREATNASGVSKARLICDGVDFGVLSSLELLALKSLLQAGDLEKMYEEMPLRADAIRWDKATIPEYKDREVYQTEVAAGVRRTTEKTTMILADPNVQYLKDTSKYTPLTTVIDNNFPIGNFSVQEFTGMATHHYRAGVLERRSKLLAAVVEALSIANQVEVVDSEITAQKIFSYLNNEAA